VVVEADFGFGEIEVKRARFEAEAADALGYLVGIVQHPRERIGGRRWLHAAQSYFHDITPAVAQRVPVAWINRKGMQPTGAARADRELRTLTELADWLA